MTQQELINVPETKRCSRWKRGSSNARGCYVRIKADQAYGVRALNKTKEMINRKECNNDRRTVVQS
jgi:hypothetical protein